MKTIFYGIVCALIFFACSKPEDPYEALDVLIDEESTSVYSLHNSAYTGTAVEWNGSAKIYYHITNGLIERVEGFYETGSKERWIDYQDGVMHGTYTLWYPDGSVYLEQTYVNGELHGAATMYTPLGEVEREVKYEQGKLVE